ncbi:hypothetical protein PR202_ga14669 [Eleusine coracana subsp. coracana]|uniref:BTB domain-containing protein n=1 Tax=Eleusine coracana subsp. coracana TaxID=191504 RepID=A0AAV5CI28_ELECO|nr:hypothetical protein PR202_ga14669 [Eleusine coracana subsp. coracana]
MESFGLHRGQCSSSVYWIMFRIALASDANQTGVTASFACRLVDLDQRLEPSVEVTSGGMLRKGQSRDILVMQRNRLTASGYVAASPVPLSSSYDLSKHLGDLLLCQKGVDVTFVVSGERVAAHRCVLAARSPVFMDELFGDMKETAAREVEVEDVEADVFRALVQFIYTDALPEELDLDDDEDTSTGKAMAQHLLAAADRYGVERLKGLCEDMICADISVATAAASLALAKQHGCQKLKAKCMDFIVATPANLRAVVVTEGYKHLMESCPSVISDLLVAVVQRYKCS